MTLKVAALTQIIQGVVKDSKLIFFIFFDE